jgi:hypothetical protein
MLRQDMRRQLREHNWLDIANAASNPQQKLTRLRDEAIQALEDLVLLAKKLPDHKQKEIFNYPNIDKLLSAILKASSDSHDSIEDSARKTELASLLVKRGAEFCIQEYRSKIETDSILNDSNISKLKNSIDICDTIAFKMKLPEIRSTERKEDLAYLFNWSKIEEIVHNTRTAELEGEDTKKFVAFCEKEFGGGGPIEIIHHIRLEPFEKRARMFQFSDSSGTLSIGGIMEIDSEYRLAELLIDGDKVKLQRNLVVKIQNDGDLYVYMERSGGYK